MDELKTKVTQTINGVKTLNLKAKLKIRNRPIMSESAALDKFLSRREEKPLLSSTSSYLTSNVRELDTVSIIQMAKSKFHHKV